MLCNTFNGFERAIRAVGFSDHSGVSNSKQCSVSNRIQILYSIKTVNPKSFLPCLLKTRVITLGFSSESINLLKGNTLAVNGKPVIIGKSNIFCTAAAFLAFVPIFVIARANSRF